MSRRRDRKGKGKGKGKGKSQRRPRTAKVEWVGGLVQTPFTIESNDGGASYEPLMALWVERPGGFVVAHELLEPGPTQGRLGAALDAALAGVGLALTANAPTRIRVATQELAAEVRDTLGPGIPIIVAPTPELDEVMSTMGQALGGSPTTLFPSPAITPDLVERFFVAARALWAAAPWRFAGDAQIIRVDAPSLGIDGACLSILGAGGQEFGLSLFESIDHYDAFMRVASSRPDPARRIDLGGEELLLSFDHERNVPKKMVTQARELGLATASENAFPTLCRVSRDASFGPPSAQDYALMTALAAAVGTFTAMHRELFEKGEGLPARRTFEHDGAPAVTLTAPYDVMYLLDEPDAIASPFSAMGAVTPERTHGAPSGKIGRNEPCPCGSGKKYKRCCIDQTSRAEPRPASLHEIERVLIADMMSYGVDRFGRDVFERHTKRLLEAGTAFAGPWMLYVLELDGAVLAEHFAADVRLSRRERAMLEAQLEAWFSVWEVVDVEPGRSISLHDLLTGEQRRVREVTASKMVRKRAGLLARVVDFEGESVLDGIHVRSLPPRETAEVVERARKRLRRKSDVPVERLRNEKMATYLLRRWEEISDEYHRRRAVPPKLQNTEGHELVLVSDHYRYERRAHDWLLERLERIEGIRLERLSARRAEMTFHMAGNPKIPSWDNTIIGKATASNGRLRVECNSRERADALRERVQKVAGDIITEHGRTFEDPMSDPNLAAAAAQRANRDAQREAEPPAPELRAVLAEHKAQYFASWLDQPIPALDGQTPREHVRTKEGRRAVELLLKDIEFMEQADPSSAFDVDVLRRELGLS